MRKSNYRGNSPPPLQRDMQQVLYSVRDALKLKLPPNWTVSVRCLPSQSAALMPLYDAPDAALTIRSPDGNRGTVLIEVKRAVDPKLVPLIAAQLESYQKSSRANSTMVVAPFLSPRTRELLRNAQLSYADDTGNLRLALERPALYVETSGANTDPSKTANDRPLRSLKGPRTGRVIRALCDFKPPYGVEELATRSHTSLGSVSRVLTLLDREALITRQPRGPVVDVKWAELIARWIQDYSFLRSNTTRSFLDPRGLNALRARLAGIELPYAITGSLAAAEISPIAVPRLATIYVDSVELAAQQLSLRPADVGGNVILAEPFDAVVYERGWERDGIKYAAASQVAADSLTSPGRGPSEGEELLRWMARHEDEWRS